ncbi:MAG: hypothetical protein JXR37_10185 [Kiritimatiellae bacterium]|nr:hypothetical protein [Kiritimatiellia bacterium]
MNKTIRWMLLIGLMAAESSRAARAGITRRPLRAEEESRVVRMLFPLPQDCRIGNTAYVFGPAACSLQADPGLTETETRFVTDFRERWKQRFGAELPLGAARAGGFSIVVGRAARFDALRQAGESGLVDLKHLATRRNAEQAYAVTCAEHGGGVTAWLAANDSPGVFYALATLNQLLSSLSGNGSAVLPQARIVDWPDIRRRGITTGIEFWTAGLDSPLQRFAHSKLNHLYRWNWLKVTADKKVRFSDFSGQVEQCARANVQMVPILVHLDYLFKPDGVLGERFPELIGKEGDKPFHRSGYPACYAQPGTQKLMDEIFEAMVRCAKADRFMVWMSEFGGQACHCAVCKGEERAQFVGETRVLVNSYRKALALNPAFRLELLFSQGTYPHNLQLLPHIPKEVGLDFYSGSGGKMGHTYKTTFGETLLPPSVDEMRRQGYRIGAVPLLEEDPYQHMLFPFYTAFFVRLRASEIADRAPDGITGWIHADGHAFNMEATAEFSWNRGGRTAHEFVVSWATRTGLRDPELAARLITLMEYPARALSAAGFGSSPPRTLERMVSLMLGTKPEWSSFFDAEKGFEYFSTAEMERLVAIGDESVALAEQLGSEELLAGARLLRQWLAILQRYKAFSKHDKDPALAARVRSRVYELSRALPALRTPWLRAMGLDETKHKHIYEKLDKSMREFDRLAGDNGPHANAETKGHQP